jgi:hypothetical protein
VRVGSSGSARLAARAALPLLTTRRTTRPSAPSTTAADVGNGEWEPLDSEPSGGPRHTSPGDAPRSGPRRGRGRPQGSGTHRGAAVGQRSRRRPDSRTGGHRPRLAAEGPPTTPRIRSSILCAGFSTRTSRSERISCLVQAQGCRGHASSLMCSGRRTGYARQSNGRAADLPHLPNRCAPLGREAQRARRGRSAGPCSRRF